MKKHQKHTALNRPTLGQFHRNEWAILGTTCGQIQQLSKQLIQQLSSAYKMSYVDADHKSADDGNASSGTILNAGANLEYTDKIDFHRFDTKDSFNEFQFRQWFNQQDAVLVNGNHFKARQQIVVIDPKKKESLSRKLDRLTDVQMILFTEGETAVYDFLKPHIPQLENIPQFRIDDTSKILDWIKQQLQKNIPVLNGLVLAGGKSQRMGKDKTALNYHGKPQTEYAHQLLQDFCKEVYVSCREDQVNQFSNFNTIKDSFSGLGPFGAILSAFQENPNAAWLVIAVDLPLVDESFLKELLDNRNPSQNATAFLNPATGFPDPLLTIWEPRSYSAMLQFLSQGYSCPRKVLINSAIELVESDQAEKLRNVNSPEDLAEIKTYLKS